MLIPGVVQPTELFASSFSSSLLRYQLLWLHPVAGRAESAPGSALPQEPPAWFFPSEPGFSPFLMEWSRFPPLFWHLALCTLALPAPPFSARELPDLALFGGTGWSFLFQRRAKGLSPLPAAGNVVLFVYSNSGGGCFRAPMGSLCLGLVLSCSL